MPGFEPHQSGFRAPRYKFLRITDRHYGIFNPMQDERRLPDIRKRLILFGVVKELIVNWPLLAVSIVVNHHLLLIPPARERALGELFAPALVQPEGRRKQNQALNGPGLPRGYQRRDIAAQAGSDQGNRL